MLEEERRARREESAIGEAVLREVRETQGLLGEVSPSYACKLSSPDLSLEIN